MCHPFWSLHTQKSRNKKVWWVTWRKHRSNTILHGSHVFINPIWILCKFQATSYLCTTFPKQCKLDGMRASVRPTDSHVFMTFMSSLWSEDWAIRLQWLRPFSARRIIFSVVNILLPPSSLAGVICQVGQVLRLHYCTELHRALHCSGSVATGIATTLLSRSFLSTDCFCCKVIPQKNKNSIERTQTLLRE